MNKKRIFSDFILGADHPCIMAQSVVKDDQLTIQVYDSMKNSWATKDLLRDLETFLCERTPDENSFDSFVAIYSKDVFKNEKDYEQSLWEFLSKVSAADPVKWDPEVEADPDSSKFSFSLLGTAFYLVGLHPQSSRNARRFQYPAIVFNLHEQFEKLRDMGAYTTVRDRIRKRDKKKNGSVNPMLEDFGQSSEARQYSGRKVSEDWKCPFNPEN